MDINIHITGLEPLANAITKLAEAYTESGQIAQDAITKAAGKGGKKGAPEKQVKEEPAVAAPESAAPAASDTTTANPVATAQETSTADSPAEATDAPAGGDANPTSSSTSETPISDQASSDPKASTTAPAAAASTAEKVDDKLTDEALRALAGEKVKTNKDAVKSLVNSYATSISEIPVAKRDEFRKALEKL